MSNITQFTESPTHIIDIPINYIIYKQDILLTGQPDHCTLSLELNTHSTDSSQATLELCTHAKAQLCTAPFICNMQCVGGAMAANRKPITVDTQLFKAQFLKRRGKFMIKWNLRSSEVTGCRTLTSLITHMIPFLHNKTIPKCPLKVPIYLDPNI